MGEHDADDPVKAPSEGDGRDVAWLQLPTVGPYTSAQPLVGEVSPKDEPTGFTTKVAAKVAPTTAQVQGVAESAGGPRAIPPCLGRRSGYRRCTRRKSPRRRSRIGCWLSRARSVRMRGRQWSLSAGPVSRWGSRSSSAARGPLACGWRSISRSRCTVVSGLFGVSAVSGSDPASSIESLYRTDQRDAVLVDYDWLHVVRRAGGRYDRRASRRSSTSSRAASSS